MARGESKDLLTRLADAGEDAIHKLADAPGADRLFGAVNSLRERMDDMQKRVRGLERIERRVADLEDRLRKLEGGTKTGSARGTATATKRATTSRARKTTSTSASAAKGSTSRGGRSASTRKTS